MYTNDDTSRYSQKQDRIKTFNNSKLEKVM